MREIAPELGIVKNLNGDKARRVPGRQSRRPEEAVIATAETRLELGVVKD